MTREELNKNLMAIKELCDDMPYCDVCPFANTDNDCKLLVSSPASWEIDENGAIKNLDLLDLLFDLQKSEDEYKMWKALEQRHLDEYFEVDGLTDQQLKKALEQEQKESEEV